MSLPPADFGPATNWAAAVLAILTILYAAVVRPLMKKKDPLDKPRPFGTLAQQRSVERQMQNALVEMSEMARQITAQIDTRAARHEELIRQADPTIAAMKSQETRPPAPTPPPPPAPPEAAADPRHAQIYALADQGHTSRDIAQQLNRPSGEIELILALRR